MNSQYTPLNMMLALIYLMTALLLSACGGSSGGDVTATPSKLGDGDVPVRKALTLIVDADNGSDSNSIDQAKAGGDGPWQSIQHALDQAQPGDIIQIQASTQAYSGARKAGAVDPSGIIMSVSGTATLPIVIEGIPDTGNNLPVIDQGRTQPDDTNPVAGLLLNCVSYVTIRGFEIRQANDAGITTSLSGCDHRGLTIEDNLIHDISGVGYVAGIRLVQVRDSLIHNNQLHSITVSSTLTVNDPPRLVEPTQAVENNRVEHNHIHDVSAAIHIRGRGNQALSANSLNKNRIHDIETGLLLSTDASHPASINNTLFTGNLVYSGDLPSNEGRAVDVQLGTSTSQSSGLNLNLNTLVDMDQPLRLSGMTDIQIQENIITDGDVDLLLSVAPPSSGILNRFSTIDNNLYFNNASSAWALGSGGASANAYPSLAAWRQAFSVSADPELSADPDLLSSQSDPQFTNPGNGDFSLLITSPARTLGISGGEIGAYYDALVPGPR